MLSALDVDGAFVNVELGSSREVKRLTFDRGERKSCTQYLDLLVTQMNKEKTRRK
ncbi:MAG: hypothetical protein IJ840_06485 [Bacteroidales bacterium]|nr:hypothetical protein [Bacteroidales bacterium]